MVRPRPLFRYKIEVWIQSTSCGRLYRCPSVLLWVVRRVLHAVHPPVGAALSVPEFLQHFCMVYRTLCTHTPSRPSRMSLTTRFSYFRIDMAEFGSSAECVFGFRSEISQRVILFCWGLGFFRQRTARTCTYMFMVRYCVLHCTW